MKTIVEIALGTMYTEEQIPSIMEVVSNTPNPGMALDILMGIWEEPVLQKSCRYNDKDLTLVSTDFWRDEVTYSYQEEETESFYINKDIDESLITLDNYEEFKQKWGDNTKHFSLKTGNFVQRTSTCDVASWIQKCSTKQYHSIEL